MQNNEIMTIRELSFYLKINEKTIYKLAKKNALPGIKIGGMYRFKKEAVDSWLINHGEKLEAAGNKHSDYLNLKENEKIALQELKGILSDNFSVDEIILYGSKARGDFDEESDIDILVILKNMVDDNIREMVFSISFNIEIKYDVIFGILVEARDFWNSRLAKTMPIHSNIDREGVLI